MAKNAADHRFERMQFLLQIQKHLSKHYSRVSLQKEKRRSAGWDSLMADSQTVKSSLFWQVLEVNSSAPQKHFNMWLLAKAQFEPEPSHSMESTQSPPNSQNGIQKQ